MATERKRMSCSIFFFGVVGTLFLCFLNSHDDFPLFSHAQEIPVAALFPYSHKKILAKKNTTNFQSPFAIELQHPEATGYDFEFSGIYEAGSSELKTPEELGWKYERMPDFSPPRHRSGDGGEHDDVFVGGVITARFNIYPPAVSGTFKLKFRDYKSFDESAPQFVRYYVGVIRAGDGKVGVKTEGEQSEKTVSEEKGDSSSKSSGEYDPWLYYKYPVKTVFPVSLEDEPLTQEVLATPGESFVVEMNTAGGNGYAFDFEVISDKEGVKTPEELDWTIKPLGSRPSSLFSIPGSAKGTRFLITPSSSKTGDYRLVFKLWKFYSPEDKIFRRILLTKIVPQGVLSEAKFVADDLPVLVTFPMTSESSVTLEAVVPPKLPFAVEMTRAAGTPTFFDFHEFYDRDGTAKMPSEIGWDIESVGVIRSGQVFPGHPELSRFNVFPGGVPGEYKAVFRLCLYDPEQCSLRILLIKVLP